MASLGFWETWQQNQIFIIDILDCWNIFGLSHYSVTQYICTLWLSVVLDLFERRKSGSFVHGYFEAVKLFRAPTNDSTYNLISQLFSQLS